MRPEGQRRGPMEVVPEAKARLDKIKLEAKEVRQSERAAA